MHVMLQLSDKIQLDKVQSNYIFNKKNRLHIEEETRILFTSTEIEEYRNTLTGNFFFLIFLKGRSGKIQN